MRWLGWGLLPVMLVGGAALGYFARSARTTTVTVVETRTTEARPATTATLTTGVSIAGASVNASGKCRLPAAGSAPSGSDIWTLRRPGTSGSSGEVVGVASSVKGLGCGQIGVTFKIKPKLGFFVVYDESQGLRWGPFDSSTLASRGWRLNLTYSGAS